MDEKIYFSQRNVKITNSHFLVGNESYPLDKIQSVTFLELEPKRWLSLICLMSGLVISAEENGLFALGGLLLTIGIVAAICATVKYAVVINMPDGEKKALISDDSFYIQQVIAFLNLAIDNMFKSKIFIPESNPNDNQLDIFDYPSTLPRTPY